MVLMMVMIGGRGCGDEEDNYDGGNADVDEDDL